MKKPAVLFSLITLSACSSYQMVNIDGVKRVELSQQRYSKPQYYINEFKPKVIKNHRTIASSEDKSEKLNLLPSKKLYFFTLWQQYSNFNSIIGTESKINSCPQFHNDLLVHSKGLKVPNNQYSMSLDYTDLKVNKKNIVNYPIMSLPYKNTDLYSYIVSTDKWNEIDDHVLAAIKSHNSKNEEELKILCQNGISGGYYIYENMVSYYRDNEEFQFSKNVLPSILKVNTISNMFLLDSMVKPEFESIHLTKFQSALLKKLKVSWFKNYLYETNLMRNNNEKRFVLKD